MPSMGDLLRFFRRNRFRNQDRDIDNHNQQQNDLNGSYGIKIPIENRIEDINQLLEPSIHQSNNRLNRSYSKIDRNLRLSSHKKSRLNHLKVNNSSQTKIIFNNSNRKKFQRPCVHVGNEKWNQIWTECFETQLAKYNGLVFVNPNFAETYYVPTSCFQCDFDSFNEYSMVNAESIADMRNNQYEKWMKTMIRSDSCYISMHCCNATEILEKFCIHCPNLSRISMHFYCLDKNVVSFLCHYFKNLISINFENSIGLNLKNLHKLSSMKDLAHLNVSGCDLQEKSLEIILTSCFSLESLNISNNCAIIGRSK